MTPQIGTLLTHPTGVAEGYAQPVEAADPRPMFSISLLLHETSFMGAAAARPRSETCGRIRVSVPLGLWIEFDSKRRSAGSVRRS